MDRIGKSDFLPRDVPFRFLLSLGARAPSVPDLLPRLKCGRLRLEMVEAKAERMLSEKLHRPACSGAGFEPATRE